MKLFRIRVIGVIFIIFLPSLFYISCENEPLAPNEQFELEYLTPQMGDTINSEFVISFRTTPQPDSIIFDFNDCEYTLGSAEEYSFIFDITRYKSGFSSAQVNVFWEDTTTSEGIDFYIDSPIILDNIQIPENQVIRNHYGSIVAINLEGMNIESPTILYGIQKYKKSLTSVNLNNNNLRDIDLTPLLECKRLNTIKLCNNRLNSINFNIIEQLDSLFYLSVSNNNIADFNSLCLENLPLAYLQINDNPLNESSCRDVNIYDNEHPNCVVITDCSY